MRIGVQIYIYKEGRKKRTFSVYFFLSSIWKPFRVCVMSHKRSSSQGHGRCDTQLQAIRLSFSFFNLLSIQLKAFRTSQSRAPSLSLFGLCWMINHPRQRRLPSQVVYARVCVCLAQPYDDDDDYYSVEVCIRELIKSRGIQQQKAGRQAGREDARCAAAIHCHYCYRLNVVIPTRLYILCRQPHPGVSFHFPPFSFFYLFFYPFSYINILVLVLFFFSIRFVYSSEFI